MAEGRQSAAQKPRAARPRIYPFHPFLFAAASVLAMMVPNLNQTVFEDIAPALAAVLAFALVAYLAAGLARRRFDAVAAVIASIWVVGVLFFEFLFGRLNPRLGGGFAMIPMLPIALVCLVALTVLATRLGRAAPAVHTLLNGLAFVLFITPAWQAAAYEWRNGGARAIYDGDRAAAGLPQIAAAAPLSDGRPPDIYHFVFDRLTSDQVLSQYFDLDTGISSFLESRGFYVARASHSNYLKTGHSLASLFYMDYLDLLDGDPRLAGDNWRPIFEMLDDHRAARFLRAKGYDYLQFGSWWVGTHENPVAAENHARGFSEFAMHYMKRTMLRPIFHLAPGVPFAMRLAWDYGQCQRVAPQMEAIKALGVRDRPTYVFSHVLLPHDPYAFASDGRCVSHEEAVARGRPQGYVDHVAYAERVIRDVVDALLAEGRPPPIILIQADEGPFPARDYTVDWQEATVDELRIKTGILNAFYLPDGDYGLLTSDITPVNTYRVLFNTVFGADFPLLPNRIYAFPNDLELYDFIDVTGKIRGPYSPSAGPLRLPG